MKVVNVRCARDSYLTEDIVNNSDSHQPDPLTTSLAMASFFSAINAKIRSQPMLSYVCSTRKHLSQLMSP